MVAVTAPVAVKERREIEIPKGLTEDDLRRMYELMLLARSLDERMWILQRQGRIAFVISCQGQEAAQVGTAYPLRPGVDWVHPYYRDVGAVLTVGMTARDLMLSAYAKAEDPLSGGRQMPNHFSHAALHIVSGSSPVITQVPQAAGIALASKIRGEDAVTVTYFGEGATSSGDFHEGLNFASIYKLPVIFVCENNEYAISVPQEKEMAVRNVADRAAAYAMPGVTVDGNDVLAVYRAMREAVDRARQGKGPTLLEAKTYRLVPHSSDDDDRIYRSRDEVAQWRQRDPVRRFRDQLVAAGILDEATEDEIHSRVAASVDDATDYAEAAPYPDISTVARRVYAT
jgi:2-oxoisovalerate dehydrogenase E1 component alpha subunit